MTANFRFIQQNGNFKPAIVLADFDTTGNRLCDQRLCALKKHCEVDGLTAADSISLLDSWSDVLRDAVRLGNVDAFIASRTLTIIGEWIGQLEDAIRARIAA